MRGAAEGDPDHQAGWRLFSGDCTFLKGVVSLSGLPAATLPEVAFIGRSNVGKSSLINALTGRKALARTSNTPGRTQELNFFDLGGRLMLVDLPGYGFAKAPKPKVDAWTRLIRDYLRGRPNLRRVNLLVDARHGIKQGDIDFMALLDTSAVVFQVVLTKADKCRPAELDDVVRATLSGVAGHVAAFPGVFVTSAETGEGLPELRTELETLADGGEAVL